ncbi:hypothetical protein PPERSA_09408 [Pseudocohnilembus persalinus]|uniref:Tubulin-tyrosine ligase/Tubulin polyglutamylase n=1 Tax=Pseudocohnilembus persalinus TaxID=266149 RepID=A0A0V0R5E0_PSEPJ|nr:hypothetical protein PPERSA_09408 [Pseudocohnilembus persalinus]|eukprot:KRX09578.1 hypothetical protein PPERSA_09408 [Pseudocohnilembus persalinus]
MIQIDALKVHLCQKYEEQKGLKHINCTIKCSNEIESKSFDNKDLTKMLKCQKRQLKKKLNISNEFDSNPEKRIENVRNQKQFMNIDREKQEIYKQNPMLHDGRSLVKLDCQKIEKKKLVKILFNFKRHLVLTYFNSRCDFEILGREKRRTRKYNFKWAYYHSFIKDKNDKRKYQLVNHIEGIQKSIWEKEALVNTLKEYDQKQLYNFNSSNIHFKTYSININSKSYDDQELEFMKKIKRGFWITKNPEGAQGLGIQVFKNLRELKKSIRKLKSQNIKQQRGSIQQYSFVQEYLANPLLLNKKKMDLRGFVLIASMDPFVVLYQDGFVRTCIEDYDVNFNDFDQQAAFKHLTNKSFQKKHPKFSQLKEQILINADDFKNRLKQEYNLDDNKLIDMQKEKHKVIAYTLMAAKEKLNHEKGVFQLLGVDIMWDENFNAKLIEVNTKANLLVELKTHKYVFPQMIQSTLDLILETMSDYTTLRTKWEYPEKLELGKWEIVINEATGYNVLNDYLLSTETKQTNDIFKQDIQYNLEL